MNSNRRVVLEIFAVLIIIVILTSFFFFRFHKIKVSVRNNTRKGKVAEIQKALLFYKNEHGHFPISEQGKCITKDGEIGEKLASLSAIRRIAGDPIWPKEKPTKLNEDRTPKEEAFNFCYWYVSPAGKNYYLSYYLQPEQEKDTKQGVITISNKN